MVDEARNDEIDDYIGYLSDVVWSLDILDGAYARAAKALPPVRLGEQNPVARVRAEREAIQRRIAAWKDRRLPVAIGDNVRIGDGRGGWNYLPVKRVARQYVYIGHVRPSAYALADGVPRGGSGQAYGVHEDDLYRINRDLVAKPRRVRKNPGETK